MKLGHLALPPLTRPRHMAPPPCRRAGCGAPVFDGLGHCFDHGLRYLLWLELRLDLDRAGLADSPYTSYAEAGDGSPLAHALDIVSFLFTPGPF